MSDKYILIGKDTIPCDDLIEWAIWHDEADRHIGKDELNGVLISTVFLGSDRGFGSDRPVLFETMVFGGIHDLEQWRYHTYAEAEVGHSKALEMIRKEFNN